MIHTHRSPPIRYGREKSVAPNLQAILRAVLSEVRQQGPLASKYFEDPQKKRGTWWNRKPARVASDVLECCGHQMVDKRVNFHCYNDLARRVLASSANRPVHMVDEYYRWATLRSIVSQRVATADQVCDYYRISKSAARIAL